MTEIEKYKNVVEATNQPNLYERLEGLQGQLTLCEKALAEYLETKRLAFPRFYFVSSADLLDILSNGNNPTAVSESCFPTFLGLLFFSTCKHVKKISCIFHLDYVIDDCFRFPVT